MNTRNTPAIGNVYIHTLDTALMAADTIACYIHGLFEALKQTAYALDRDSHKAALARFPLKASGKDQSAEATEEQRLAA